MFHILVVDDDKNTRYLLREILEIDGYVVYTASNGNVALEMLQSTHVDLVIVDVMMPEKDGYTFTKEVRSFNSILPILMVSAKQLPEDRKKGFIAGIDDYMSKPIDPEELSLHVKALLRRSNLVSNHKIIIDTEYSTLNDTEKVPVNIEISQASVSGDMVDALQKDPSTTKTLTFNMYAPRPGEQPYAVKMADVKQ